MRRSIAAASVALAALALAVTACAPGGAASEPAPAASASTSSTSRPPLRTMTPGPVAPTGTPVDVPTARWDALLTDLAARGVTTAPELVSAEAVTFNDGSLGCGSPGQSYTQAQVDGLRVVVTADGKTYDYRFGTGDAPKLCAR